MTMPVRPQAPAGDVSERLPVHPAILIEIGPQDTISDASWQAFLTAAQRAKPVSPLYASSFLARSMEAFLSSGDSSANDIVLGVQVRLTRVRSAS